MSDTSEAIEMSTEMSEPELQAFVDANFYGAVATLRRDGAPVNTPVGVVRLDGQYYISTRDGSPLGKRLRRDPRLSLTVFAKTWPPSYVVLQGRVEPIDDSDGTVKRALARPSTSLFEPPDGGVEAWLDAYVLVPRDVFRIQVDKEVTMSEQCMPVDVFTTWVVTPPEF